MESKVQKMKKSTDVAEENDGVTAEKIKFPLYVFPETMKTVDILYKSDNCSSRTEFMEKSIRFYCGYLLQNKPELVATMLCSSAADYYNSNTNKKWGDISSYDMCLDSGRLGYEMCAEIIADTVKLSREK